MTRGVLAFEIDRGMDAVERLLPRLRLANLAPNLGQVETTVGPAAVTSHVELSDTSGSEICRSATPQRPVSDGSATSLTWASNQSIMWAMQSSTDSRAR